jgi:hypothetical protein
MHGSFRQTYHTFCMFGMGVFESGNLGFQRGEEMHKLRFLVCLYRIGRTDVRLEFCERLIKHGVFPLACTDRSWLCCRRALQTSEEIELWLIGSAMVEERETTGCGPVWIRSLPAEASEVSRTFGVEDNTFLFEQLLLVASRTDFTLGVDDSLPGDRWLWMVIT